MEVIAGAGAAVWIVLAALKVNPKAQYVILALVGLGVSGGFLGTWLGKIGSWIGEASTTGTGALVGASTAWAIPYTVALWTVLVFLPDRFAPAGTANSKTAPGWGDWVHVTTLVTSLLFVPSLVISFIAIRDAITSGNSGAIWAMLTVVGLATWIVFALLQVYPKAQYVFLALFGAGVSGGVMGDWLGTVGSWLGGASEAGAAAVVGVPLVWALALSIVVWYVLVLIPQFLEPAGTAEGLSAPSWTDYVHVITILVSPLFVPSLVLVWNGAGAALSGLGA